MTSRELVALNEAVPQLQVPQAGDTYLLPRDMDAGGNDITGVGELTATTVNGATPIATVNAKTGTAVALDVYDIPYAVEDVPADGGVYVRTIDQWVSLTVDPSSGTTFTIQSGEPIVAGLVAGQIVLDEATGIFYRWELGSAGQSGYAFDGTQYAVMSPAWTTKGDPAIYSEASYNFTGLDGAIIDTDKLSLTDIGRTGSDPYSYYTGTLSELRLVDNSPLQNTYTPEGTATLTTAIDMSNPEGRNGVVRFDYKYVNAASGTNILQGTSTNLIRCVGAVLTIDATNCVPGSLKVDGVSYGIPGPTLIDGQHYIIEFETRAGDLKTAILANGAAMNNLIVEVQN